MLDLSMVRVGDMEIGKHMRAIGRAKKEQKVSMRRIRERKNWHKLRLDMRGEGGKGMLEV